MIEKIFFDKTALKDSAYRVCNEPVKRIFTEEQIAQLKDDFFQAKKAEDVRAKALTVFSTALANDNNAVVQETIKELSKMNFGDDGTKLLKESSKELMKKINLGYAVQDEEVYYIDHQDIERMAIYDADGVLLYDRPLYAEERQTNLLSNIRKIS